MEIVTDYDEEGVSLHPSKNKPDRKPSGDDPISDWLLKIYYLMNQRGMIGVKIGIAISPIVLIFLFSLFVSNSTSNLIAFSALVISFGFMLISLWILCDILDKDQGTREM